MKLSRVCYSIVTIKILNVEKQKDLQLELEFLLELFLRFPLLLTSTHNSIEKAQLVLNVG